MFEECSSNGDVEGLFSGELAVGDIDHDCGDLCLSEL